MVIRRFDVFLVSFEPKAQPCVIVSPDEMNEHLRTVIIAPMTTEGRPGPTRISCRFQRKKGRVVLDQLRTIDKTRLLQPLGRLPEKTTIQVLQTLQEMFAE